jgi:hypothetical protein
MRFTVAMILSFLALDAFAGDAWLPIAGSVNNFRTDARILNTSGEDIEVSAYFLPTDVTDNVVRISAPPVKIAVPKRSMKVLDDVVTTVFGTTGIGAILFTAPQRFEASSRIYAVVETGTLGQFSSARSPGLATARGAIFQLKANALFRTNIGAVNIANADSIVTWTLYDRNNIAVTTASRTLVAYEVLRPTAVQQIFPDAGSADLSDCWVSFTATNPIFAYGSVVDNRTTDPTFVPAILQD